MGFERRTASYAGMIGAFKERREQLGHTQMQFDQIIGWSDGTINKYEHFAKPWGKHLGAHSLPLILSALGLELIVVERGAFVARFEPARFVGPGDALFAEMVGMHEKTASGPVALASRDMTGQVGTAVGAMSSAEAAELLGVSIRTVKRWIADGLIVSAKPGAKRNSRRLVLRSSVEALLQAGRPWANGGATVGSPPLAPELSVADLDDDAGQMLKPACHKVERRAKV